MHGSRTQTPDVGPALLERAARGPARLAQKRDQDVSGVGVRCTHAPRDLARQLERPRQRLFMVVGDHAGRAQQRLFGQLAVVEQIRSRARARRDRRQQMNGAGALFSTRSELLGKLAQGDELRLETRGGHHRAKCSAFGRIGQVSRAVYRSAETRQFWPSRAILDTAGKTVRSRHCWIALFVGRAPAVVRTARRARIGARRVGSSSPVAPLAPRPTIRSATLGARPSIAALSHKVYIRRDPSARSPEIGRDGPRHRRRARLPTNR